MKTEISFEFANDLSKQVQYLDFDSKIFGFRVAKILPTKLDYATLQTTLIELRANEVKLVYWLSDSQDSISQQAAVKLNGFLASEQVTYLIELQTLKQADLQFAHVQVYSATTATPELEHLAFQAGNYSRFRNDRRIPEKCFYEIYKQWIANSCNKSIATEVLVIKEQKKIAAMITLGEKNSRGDIGLLAVNADFRGRGYGEALVKTAQLHFINQGNAFAQVVTQKANLPACGLYEKCGFKPEKVENIYHFWL